MWCDWRGVCGTGSTAASDDLQEITRRLKTVESVLQRSLWIETGRLRFNAIRDVM